MQTETSREFSASYNALDEALSHDSAELQSEVLLWQRWIRYAAALLASICALVQLNRGAEQRAWAPIAIAGGVYYLFNGFIALFLKHGSGKALPPRLPAFILVADIAMVSSIVYFSTPPAQYHLILLLGFLILQLTVFYFGTTHGVWAAVLTLFGYVSLSQLAPAHLPGPRPSLMVVLFNMSTFILVGGVLVFTFGNFRKRMNKLRQFCKRVEIGDLTGSFDADKDKRPDDLTLLARSVDEMRHRLIELIGTDALTGCMNRRAFEMRLRREWRIARRRGSMLALLAIDIDNFKVINDTRGHPVGDQVLQELAEIMRTTARETDSIARLGGDEFVILLPDAGWQGATTFAERLRRNVDDHDFGDDRTLDVTISVGVALARGGDDVTSEYLLEEADRSLYKAKEGGRNRISA
jgi:diguanylate cyclase (GGDEF)-like protein